MSRDPYDPMMHITESLERIADHITKKHTCQRPSHCICRTTDMEPKEDCPVHGSGEWPPRCETCGCFMVVDTPGNSDEIEREEPDETT